MTDDPRRRRNAALEMAPDPALVVPPVSFASLIRAVLLAASLATAIARAIAGENLVVSAAFTGRANLYATAAGLVAYDQRALDEARVSSLEARLAGHPRGQLPARAQGLDRAGLLDLLERQAKAVACSVARVRGFGLRHGARGRGVPRPRARAGGRLRPVAGHGGGGGEARGAVPHAGGG